MSWHSLIDRIFFGLILCGSSSYRHCRVVIQSLFHQLQGQRIPQPISFLDLGPFVLKPNLNLGFVQPQLGRQTATSFLGQVVALLELVFEPLELLGAEGRARALFLSARVGCFAGVRCGLG